DSRGPGRPVNGRCEAQARQPEGETDGAKRRRADLAGRARGGIAGGEALRTVTWLAGSRGAKRTSVKIGPYETEREIGRGGMGVVVRGRGPDGRDVAIKLLLHANVDAVARFERERRLLGSLGENEGFVPLLDAGDSQRGPYIVMPFVPGGTLRNRMR